MPNKNFLITYDYNIILWTIKEQKFVQYKSYKPPFINQYLIQHLAAHKYDLILCSNSNQVFLLNINLGKFSQFHVDQSKDNIITSLGFIKSTVCHKSHSLFEDKFVPPYSLLSFNDGLVVIYDSSINPKLTFSQKFLCKIDFLKIFPLIDYLTLIISSQTIFIWDVSTKKTSDNILLPANTISDIQFSQFKMEVFAIAYNINLKEELKSAINIYKFDEKIFKISLAYTFNAGYNIIYNSLSFSPSNEYLLIATGNDCNFYCFDVVNNLMLLTQNTNYSLNAISINNDAHTVALSAVSPNKIPVILIYDLRNHKNAQQIINYKEITYGIKNINDSSLIKLCFSNFKISKNKNADDTSLTFPIQGNLPYNQIDSSKDSFSTNLMEENRFIHKKTLLNGYSTDQYLDELSIPNFDEIEESIKPHEDVMNHSQELLNITNYEKRHSNKIVNGNICDVIANQGDINLKTDNKKNNLDYDETFKLRSNILDLPSKNNKVELANTDKINDDGILLVNIDKINEASHVKNSSNIEIICNGNVDHLDQPNGINDVDYQNQKDTCDINNKLLIIKDSTHNDIINLHADVIKEFHELKLEMRKWYQNINEKQEQIWNDMKDIKIILKKFSLRL